MLRGHNDGAGDMVCGDSEPSQIERQLSGAAAGDALILNFLKDTSPAS
jgi:hypothetical protein